MQNPIFYTGPTHYSAPFFPPLPSFTTTTTTPTAAAAAADPANERSSSRIRAHAMATICCRRTDWPRRPAPDPPHHTHPHSGKCKGKFPSRESEMADTTRRTPSPYPGKGKRTMYWNPDTALRTDWPRRSSPKTSRYPPPQMIQSPVTDDVHFPNVEPNLNQESGWGSDSATQDSDSHDETWVPEPRSKHNPEKVRSTIEGIETASQAWWDESRSERTWFPYEDGNFGFGCGWGSGLEEVESIEGGILTPECSSEDSSSDEKTPSSSSSNTSLSSAHLAYITAFPNGHALIATPTTDYQCGIHAAIRSLRSQHPYLPSPTFTSLRSMLHHPTYLEHAAAFGLTNEDNFHVDQIGAMLYPWGQERGLNLRVKYVAEGEEPMLLPHEDQDEEGDVAVVWVHNDNRGDEEGQIMGHWSGMREL